MKVEHRGARYRLATPCRRQKLAELAEKLSKLESNWQDVGKRIKESSFSINSSCTRNALGILKVCADTHLAVGIPGPRSRLRRNRSRSLPPAAESGQSVPKRKDDNAATMHPVFMYQGWKPKIQHPRRGSATPSGQQELSRLVKEESTGNNKALKATYFRAVPNRSGLEAAGGTTQRGGVRRHYDDSSPKNVSKPPNGSSLGKDGNCNAISATAKRDA